ncbi:hypothetical protein CF392_08320 [Tamilnaduibacter salinus]|uniref:OmpA-like domain-containing protein n=1 Tax=Tamilnaduibacter salinus TaxID=1484056 RepID=A0A2A2I2V8_9GAMM|nr:OmpA family protein [Tamilnaduibacter salinus]PAV25967.1 hypothetical protein CF392_08320 [Tamilnaduibacter salinus]
MANMRPLAAAALAAAMATPAFAAEDHSQHIYINPSIGMQLFDEDRDLSETDTFNIGLEYRFTDRWAVEGAFSRANADRQHQPGNSGFQELRLDGLYYFANPHDTWNPYVAVGAGDAEWKGDAGRTKTLGTFNTRETRVNAGAGFRYNFSEGFSARFDVREFHGIDDSTFDTQASLGFSLAFGRSADSEPAPEPEPMDSDNDGVNDNRDQCPNTASGASVNSQGCETDADNDGVVDSADQCPNTPTGASVDSRGCETDSDNDGVVDSRDECPGTSAGATVDNTGCTGETESVETFTLNIQFPTNSSVIGNQYDAELQRVADFLKANPETIVEIAGHTDSAGEASYNQALSQRRAEAVANRLVERLNVDSSRVGATGYGESEPVASNDTASGRAENRRVEARIQVER